VDIAREFDSVSWSFLFEVLNHIGFPLRWADWLLVLLSTANMEVMLNGSLRLRIYHGWWLHQGDPLSPMLFLLIMEVLSAMFHKANEWSLLH
jgi:hypothetical protein